MASSSQAPAVGSILAAAGALLIGLGLQALGLVHVELLLPWVSLVGIVLIACLVTSRGDRVRWSGPPGLLLVLAVWTALQLVPLPWAALRAISPVALDVRGLGATPSGWLPITLDANATLIELARLLAYCSLALVLSQAARHDRSRRVLVWGVVCACAVFAVVSVAHTILGAKLIWGVYAPRDLRTGLVRSTLINANHIGGVFAASAPLIFSLAMRTEGRRRWLLLASGAAVVLLAFMTLSRGGAIACLIGCGAFAVAVTRRSGRRSRRTYVSQVVVAAGAAFGVALMIAFAELRQVVQSSVASGVTTENKVRAWKDAMGLIRDYWLTGSGRGTFSQVFTRYREMRLPRDLTFHYPENVVVQLAAEWGVPVAIGTLAIGVVWLVKTWRMSLGHRTRTAAVAGLTALLAQNLVDFSLEVPAIAALAIALASLAATTPSRSAQQAPVAGSPVLTRMRALPWVVAGLAVVLPLAGWSTIVSHEYRRDAVTLGRVLSHQTSVRTGRQQIEAATQRHPADHAIALLAGEWAARRRLPETMSWLNRAQFLNPRGGSVHIAVARALALGGYRNQALLELRLAHQAEPLRGHEIARFAVKVAGSVPLLRVYVSTGRGSGSRAVALSEALRETGRSLHESSICRALASRRDPDYRHYGMACLSESLQSLDDKPAAGRAARELLSENPRADLAARGIAVLGWAGRPEEVHDALLRAVRANPRDTGLLQAAARDARERGDWNDLLGWSRRIATTAGTNTTLLASASYLEGQAYLGMSRPHSALTVCERGLAESPEHPSLLRCVADAAYAAGDRRRAQSTYRELAATGHSDAVVESRLRNE